MISKTGTIAVAALLPLAACSSTQDHHVLSTRFAFPNSNVETLGHAAAEESVTTVMVPFMASPVSLIEMRRRVLQKALDQYQADLLIDSRWITKTTSFPFLPIATTTLRIEGTAARMNIGRQ
jgi:hypothetical protein